MSFVVNVLQLLFYKLGINLCGRDIRVTQHLLYGVEICAVFQQMRRERVAQSVGRDVLVDMGLLLV